MPFTAVSEVDALSELRAISKQNTVNKSMIGMGYYDTHTPAVILRNIFENPQWYTAYTPYQAEISQGRLEMLLNFQTMCDSLTGMDISCCSLLDEGSAAGEAMNMSNASFRGKRAKFFVNETCHPQTIGVVQTRGRNLGVEIEVGKVESMGDSKEYSGVLIQYPDTFGNVETPDYYQNLKTKLNDTKLVVATDLLAATMLPPPGDFGADIVVGSAQRFGVPMFYGGPHAGFLSTKDSLKRIMPGRLIGVSQDSQGNRALRMALQTREQFIKREKATSNICTAQALLANAATAYAIYHGPEGLRDIAVHVNDLTKEVETRLRGLDMDRLGGEGVMFFDTLTYALPVSVDALEVVQTVAERTGINLRHLPQHNGLGLSVDEPTTSQDVDKLVACLLDVVPSRSTQVSPPSELVVRPQDSFMQHAVFNQYRSETSMLRYLASLEAKDLTLAQCMIPLGSCTMKLNATSEMIPIGWKEFADMHPFAPLDQAQGYMTMITQLNQWLASLTGFDAMSTQPNSGATGEYAGLQCIQRFHAANGDSHRKVCLIPNSAHGTNPASAVMCGTFKVGPCLRGV